MGGSSFFSELKDVLEKAGVLVRTELFAQAPASAGGLCWIEGKACVILDAAASEPERARALLEAVEQLGLDALRLRGSDLSPELLRKLSRRGNMPWPSLIDAPPMARAGRSRKKQR